MSSSQWTSIRCTGRADPRIGDVRLRGKRDVRPCEATRGISRIGVSRLLSRVRAAVAQSFEETAKAIAKVPGLRADLVRLNGQRSAELLRYAEYAKAELIVLGLRRHYGLRRLLGGDVA
jgi:nucleotide-binding universal stress UspA family protein